MVIFERTADENGNYVCKNVLMPLELAANTEKKVPLEWITQDGSYVGDEFIEYALPLMVSPSIALLTANAPALNASSTSVLDARCAPQRCIRLSSIV